jgi:hypothetical protein
VGRLELITLSLLARQLLAYLHYTQFVKSIKGRWFAAFQVHAQSLIFIPEPALSFNTPISSHPLSLLTLEHLSISQPNVLGLRGLNSEASVSFSKSSSSYSCDSSLAIAALLNSKMARQELVCCQHHFPERVCLENQNIIKYLD